MMFDFESANGSSGDAITRREFVKASSALMAASAIGPAAWAASPRQSTDTIRVGLIGCGGRGTGAAFQAVSADPNVELHAMGDVFADQIESSLKNLQGASAKINVPKQRQFAGFEAYKGVIDSDVDIVILATTPVFRPMHLEYAIERGRHVFCEKPVAVDAPGVRRVLEVAKQAKQKKLSLMSGFCWRYNFAQRATYEMIHNGAIGEVRAIHTTYNTGPLEDVPRRPEWSDMQWQLRNWKAFTWLSGDHIVEQAIHAIDWINWAKREQLPQRAFAVGGRQCRGGPWTGNMFDHFSVVYEYADGTRAHHMCRQIPNCSNDNTAHIIGSEGSCRSNPWGPECVIEGRVNWRHDGPVNDMYQTEHDELIAAIRTGQPIDDGESMANSTMMGILGRMCAYTGQKLTWEQAINSQESLEPASWDMNQAIAFPAVAKPGETPFV